MNTNMPMNMPMQMPMPHLQNNSNLNTNSQFNQPQNKQDQESLFRIGEEIKELKNSFLNNHNNILKRIDEMKIESSDANKINTDALRELANLKKELENIRKDEEIRRKYIYDIIFEQNKPKKIEEININIDKDKNKNNFKDKDSLIGKNIDELIFDFDKNSIMDNSNKKKIDNINNMRTTNQSIFSSKTNFQMNATTKFIDMVTKEVYSVNKIK
jgi:hypothetical protein